MTPSLDTLPFDVLFYICTHLKFDDILSLGHTCRQLKAFLSEPTLSRRAIESHVPFTKEARLAQQQKISYCEAMSKVHDRRHAFSTAQPFSAYTFGQVNDFLYHGDFLCVLEGSIIRVLDADVSTEICIIDLSSIDDTPSASSSSPIEPRISLLSFNDDIVVVHYEKKGKPAINRLLAFNTARDVHGPRRRCNEPLTSSQKLFARHNADCVYYGTYSGEDDLGHTQWEIRGVSLSHKYDISECDSLPLENFFGTDIGSTLAFAIHNDFFYAVSNQTSFEVEEIDWTSFYHCIRFPLENPQKQAIQTEDKVYRRQHAEGPIHDTWTEISLQFDESTDKVMIVEARREWLASTSRQQRTFYITEFKWRETSPSTSEDGSPVADIVEGPSLPEGDSYVGVLDPTNKPNWAPEEFRPRWKYHVEIAPESGKTRTFLLAQTKFKGYNYTCQSFLDLIEDKHCCDDSVKLPCLRLRIGTRREAPMGWTPPGEGMHAASSSSDSAHQEHDVVYRHPPVKLWPPSSGRCACSKRLHEIMNPPLPGPAHNRSVVGVLDEYRFVYLVRPGRSDNTLGSLVVINFSRIHSALTPDEAGSHGARANSWTWIPGACKRGQCW